MKLKNKKVIITGGASGMGKATAELFCKEGAQVAILDINKNEGEKTTKIINDKSIFFGCNCCNFFSRVISRFLILENFSLV